MSDPQFPQFYAYMRAVLEAQQMARNRATSDHARRIVDQRAADYVTRLVGFQTTANEQLNRLHYLRRRGLNVDMPIREPVGMGVRPNRRPFTVPLGYPPGRRS